MNFMEHTIGQLLERQVEKHPNHEALVYPEHGLRLTYEQFNNRVNDFAKGLVSIGIKKGDHIAVWSDNKGEWIISQFATAKIGAVLVTVNTNYQAFELEYLLQQSNGSTLIMVKHYNHSIYLDILDKICPSLRSSERVKLQSETLSYLKNLIVLDEVSRHFALTFSDISDKGESV